MKNANGLKAEIIAVGSELLTPFFLDTNSLYLTEKLNDIGISPSFKTVVGDDRPSLIAAFRTAIRRSRLVICIGGLGPTEDDRTREVLAEATGRKLVFRREILEIIRQRFARRGLRVPSSNRKQCFVLEGAEILANPNGTAPGQWVDLGKTKIALLPGPPHELKSMFESRVYPKISGLGRGFSLRRVLKITGIGESLMESRIRDLYPTFPPELTVSTLACPGELQIRLTYQGSGPEDEGRIVLESLESRLLDRLGEFVFSATGESMEEVVGRLLRLNSKTLACAESCTGGLLGHRMTNVPGSSEYFLGSVVSYGNKAKTVFLGVPSALIGKHGAVSSQVARAMAQGVRNKSGADYGLAITGIAGPTGGTPRKPVGLVYTALAREKSAEIARNVFFGTREQVKFQSTQKAMDLLRRDLLKKAGIR